MALLEVEGLVKYYGRRQVVAGVSFHVNGGEIVGLLGPNGAGKTTSFRMTTGMVPPYTGKVLFSGHDVTHWPMYKRARLGMGYLSQESSIFRKLTVEQNILAILEAMPGSRSLGRRLTRKERWERTDGVLEQFGLTRVRKSLAMLLSGGEKRRLEIARCLVCEPLLILLDEPFTGIDPITIADIQGIVRQLRDQGIGLLVTDHNVRETLRITDRSYVITDGVVEAHGTPQEIVCNEVVIKKYLGRDFGKDAFPVAAKLPVVRGPWSVPEDAVGQRATDSGPRTTATMETPSPVAATVHQILEQEKIHRLVESLKTEARESAEEELITIGQPAVPALLEALSVRDLEMRCLAFHVLGQITGGVAPFDAYAPEAQRREQIDHLRAQLLRKAG